MKLRKLEIKDAPLMLEWMHDESVIKDLRANFLQKTLEDCVNFIICSWNDKRNWNMAIADEANIYVGTVSLKNITNNSAEFGITVRTSAMGKGYAIRAMRETLLIGFEKMNLEKIYWCVSPNNKRAVRFYDKNGFKRVKAEELDMIKGYSQDQISAYIWYMISC